MHIDLLYLWASAIIIFWNKLNILNKKWKFTYRKVECLLGNLEHFNNFSSSISFKICFFFYLLQ